MKVRLEEKLWVQKKNLFFWVSDLMGKDKEGLMHVELIDMLLSNSAAGLIDLNLVQKQKVLGAFATIEEMNDYSIHILGGTPKQGQSLKRS